MTPIPRTSRSVRDAIGTLCLAGDHACSNGDLAALREIAHQLADFAPEPLHCELAKLAATCGGSLDGAVAAWDVLKLSLHREIAE